MHIDERIRKYCISNGISGVEIGKILGLKKSPLTDWKNGKSKPTLEQIITICDYYAISSDFLIFGKERQSELSTEEQKLINIYRQLPYDKQVSIRERALIYLEDGIETTSSEYAAEFADNLDVKTKKLA